MNMTAALQNPTTNRNAGSDGQCPLVVHRLTLQAGKTSRLPANFREFHVLAGCGWVSINGEDIILQPGDVVSLASTRDFAVLTTLGAQPFIVEAPELE